MYKFSSVYVSSFDSAHPPKKSGIYAIFNTFNDKIYIGQTIDFYSRHYDHKWKLRKNIHDNKRLTEEYNKFEHSCFLFVVLELASVEDLDEKEQKYIDELHSYNPKFGYNILKYVKSCRERTISEETRKKLSLAAKGHKVSDETRALLSMKNKGRRHTLETRQKMSFSKKGTKCPWARETAKKRRGSKWSTTQREKIRQNPQNTKLTWEDIKDIRKRNLIDCPVSQIMIEFSLSKTTVVKILDNKTWYDPDYIPIQSRYVDRSGENSSNALLDWNSVRQIRKFWDNGEKTQPEMAEIYGVNVTTINHICLRKSWTEKENIDIPNKNKILRQPKNGTLTWADVFEIRAKRKEGLSYKEISLQYSVTLISIRRICNNLTWKVLQEEELNN